LHQNKVLGRILTQTIPLIVNGAQSPLHVGIEIELLQGLQLASVYRGPVVDGVFVNNSDVDALLTFVARSSAPLVIESLVAIHTHTEAQRAAVLANETCDGCVVEQLVLQGRVVSPRLQTSFLYFEANLLLTLVLGPATSWEWAMILTGWKGMWAW